VKDATQNNTKKRT